MQSNTEKMITRAEDGVGAGVELAVCERFGAVDRQLDLEDSNDHVIRQRCAPRAYRHPSVRLTSTAL